MMEGHKQQDDVHVLNHSDLSSTEWQILKILKARLAAQSTQLEKELAIPYADIVSALHELHSRGLVYFGGHKTKRSVELIATRITEKGIKVLRDKEVDQVEKTSETLLDSQENIRSDAISPLQEKAPSKISKLEARYVEYQAFSEVNISRGFFCGSCVYYISGRNDCSIVFSEGESYDGDSSDRIAPNGMCALWKPNLV